MFLKIYDFRKIYTFSFKDIYFLWCILKYIYLERDEFRTQSNIYDEFFL